jgi:Protein of unknown function (DUF3126)
MTSREMSVDVSETKKVDAYLKRLFDNPKIRVVPRAKKDSADVHIADAPIGALTVDDEDGDRSYNFRMEIALGPSPKDDIPRLVTYLRGTLGSDKIRVMARARKNDSLEVYVGDEFVGVLFIDEKKNARSAILEMAILDVDLEQDSEMSSL